ncbi:MAG: hypothetical protein ACI4JF_01100 [Oscillospiraceae bacterium]
MADTLCRSCSRAYPGNGCWADNFNPVPGWTAVERTMINMGKPIVSYRVVDCPMFEKDKPRK